MIFQRLLAEKGEEETKRDKKGGGKKHFNDLQRQKSKEFLKTKKKVRRCRRSGISTYLVEFICPERAWHKDAL